VTLTPKQSEAAELLQRVKQLLLYGGSRSGKTFFVVSAIVAVCLLTNARCLITRRYATDVRASIWNQTLPEVLRAHDLRLGADYRLNEQQMSCTFPSGGQIALAGLDDKERVDKVLGQEYAVIYVNECQDVPWATVNVLKTRLSQRVDGFDNRFIADLNPTTDAHWSAKLWLQGIHPETREPIKHPENYGWLQMNPHDNAGNLPESYLDDLSGLVGNARQRFFLGEFQNTSGLRVFNPAGLYDWPEFVAWAQPWQGVLKFTAGLDLGYQDADAFQIMAYVPAEPEVWIIYEHKARRETLEELVSAIRAGMAWVRANVPARDHSLRIYAETATLRYGHEGDDKKSASMLAEVYGLPIERAYKRDKKLGIELLQDAVNSGRLKVPRGGPFHDETEQTIWTREVDGTIVRKIDDDSYHPDLMDAVLYPLRELWSYGDEVHKSLPAPPEPPPPPSVDETFLRKFHELTDNSADVW
jgi:PBSX family phage terminase large subunit